ncbi:DnaB-like helicase C-terminal domain-containing protein [Rhizobium sp. AC27/96]|uniref:DnaB-like helicase C-terminal domain-containing protein n=1 Tax=Rhizobium sp. AC27/96 TaxID=1841653 RepID=UPI001FCD02BF|nr:DnaB-like helicase C-terminal domain-containing protein [Rhizobium sp. AC27/96]
MEAEQMLLGAILVNNAAYWQVAGFLNAGHFHEPLHRKIYDVAGTMIAQGRGANPVTVKSYLSADEKVGDLTVSQYLARLSMEAVSVAGAGDFGRTIIEMWSRRELITLAADLDNLSRYMPVDMNPEKVIGEFATRLTQIATEGNERAGATKYGVILPDAVNKAAKASLDTSGRIPWFIDDITQKIGNMRRGNLVGLMSDSGGGKTAMSLQQCRYAAACGFKTAFFSVEVSEEEAALQAAAQEAHVPLSHIDSYTLTSKEESGLEKEIIKAVDLPFYIVGFGECSLSDIRVKAESMVKSLGIDLIVIDHAKMISLPNPKDIFAERVNALYRGLKAIAKSLNVAIVILIQRNDDWKTRWRSGGSIRPMMGDAYGGGSIKQNLDVWFSLYRPEPLYKELIPQVHGEEKRDALIRKYEDSRGKAWIINHKRRRGEPGQSAEIRFEAEYTMFAAAYSGAGEPAFDGFEDF